MSTFYIFSLVIILLAGLNLVRSSRMPESRERKIGMYLNGSAFILMLIAVIIKLCTD